MPTEFRFDELDLREEPPTGKLGEGDDTEYCTTQTSDFCTRTCNGSRNTGCTSYYC